MAEFAYIARDGSGQRVTGTITAGNRREAVAAISGRSLFPIEVTGAGVEASGKKIGRIPAQILAVTFGQMADLLRSGVPLLRAIDVLRNQSNRPAMKEVLSEIHHEVEQGVSLSEAMGKYPRTFNEMSVSMVRAGSEGGFLEEALARIAEFTETQDDLRKRTMGAIAYPAFLAVIGAGVVTALMIFFVPTFETLFADMRQQGELPLMTDIVLGISHVVQSWGIWMLLVAIVGGMFARKWLDRKSVV